MQRSWDNLLADWTLPQASISVETKVSLEVEALEVSAVVASGRKGHPLASDGTPLKKKVDCETRNTHFPFQVSAEPILFMQVNLEGCVAIGISPLRLILLCNLCLILLTFVRPRLVQRRCTKNRGQIAALKNVRVNRVYKDTLWKR